MNRTAEPIPRTNFIFLMGYINAMLFVHRDDDDTDEDGDTIYPWETLGVGEISPEFFAKIREACRAFLPTVRSILGARPEPLAYVDWHRVGIDFYYSSNGHGTGFSSYPEVYGRDAADQLQEACRYSGFEEYLGDDGKVYG